MGFHYFTCFQSIVPWDGAWAEFPLLRWGHLGVHLFFAISGCVIAMTLERCTGLDDFAVRRFARLWPTTLLCSLLSDATLALLPSPWPPKPADLLPSLSFIDGFVWNQLIPGLDAGWIDVAYGSLDSRPCEIQTAASSRSDVTADKRTGAVLAVAPGVFGGVSNAPNRATTHMTTADKAQKSPCRPRQGMARSSQRML